jgi:diguanylate cyclase (GGDEF)-like protein
MRPDFGFDSVSAPSRRDVHLGASLVAAFALVLVCTSWALDPHRAAVVPAVVVGSSMLAVDVGLLWLPWWRLAGAALLVFPLLLMGGDVVLAVRTTGVAPNYTGFFMLAFIYVGLTQDRVVLPALAAVAALSWLACQDNLSASTWIKLSIASTIWMAVGWILATRTARDRALARELIAKANTDVLTGLASRVFLSDQIDRALHAPGHAVSSVMLLDLDGFKNVNDTFGHATGDELLVAVADRIRATIRPDDFCARLGGDEFAVLLRDGDLSRTTDVARRLLLATAEPIALTRGRVSVTASIGVANLDGSANAQEVLGDADVAMYEAKAAGRNRVSVFQRDMQERRCARLQLETELRDALECQEFEMYYQPVVHLRTGAIIGTEALLRWNHPRRGLLTPDQFLATAEDIGVLVALGDWILNEACRQASRWQPADPARALTMAINLSGPEMLDADAVTRVRDILTATGLPGELLVLEITERLLISDAPAIRKRIDEFKKLGVRIAIDDFGTGYSSLAYLREFPVDILKIDQSFVRPLGIDTQATALLRSIIAIADALKLDIVVEGVETQTQVEILTGLGCEVAQGFHFARPGPVDLIKQLTEPQQLSRSDGAQLRL